MILSSQKILLPIGDIITGQSISQHLNFLLESQWWTKEQIKDYQEMKLRKLIKHSTQTVPYYYNLFKQLGLKAEDIQTHDDLKKLPILTKGIIKKAGIEQFTSSAILKRDLYLTNSSGSTGKPLQYYTTKDSLSFGKAAGIRAWYWMDYKLGDKYIKISSNPRNSVIKWIQDIVNSSYNLHSEHLTEGIFLGMIEKIESINPRIIRGYPIILDYLAQIIEKRGGIKLGNLKAINTTGGLLHSFMRKRIQEIFKVNIYDSYSCEGGSVFSQCELLDNYHPSEEHAISEFLEDEFSRNDPDGAKRYIATDLFNYATPFIRYDTQDYMVLGENKICKCGRNYLNISKIKGRDGDILVLPNGHYLTEGNFLLYFNSSKSVEQFQVYQERKNIIQITLTVNDLFNRGVKQEIYNYWKNYFGDEVELLLKIVDEIVPMVNGKHRFVIRNPEIKII